MTTAAWLTLLVLVLGQADRDDERLKRFESMRRAAELYEVRLASGAQEKLRLQAEPVLRWTNPVRGTTDGAVFLWLADGRPELAMGIYKWPSKPGDPNMEHELSSLSIGKLVSARDGDPVWTPSRPGFELRPIPGAVAPAETATLRLAQLRALAREFTAVHDDEGKPTEELRLLTQPIYRYASTNPDVLDGALFAFVQATDPEVLLLIETRPMGGGHSWHYGLARMTSRGLRARHQDREVWKVPNCWTDVTNRNEPYTAFFKQRDR